MGTSGAAPDSGPESKKKPNVVIIGGGFGGLKTADTLKKENVCVTVIDYENHHTFQPLLYQVATAALSPADIAYPIRSIFKHQKNCQVVLGHASNVDVETKAVHLDDGSSISYDYLIVAAGARTNYFGHDDWALYGLGLKSLDDAIEIRRRILLAFEAAEREPDDEARARLMTFVVIGGGPTGLEIAGALSELSARVLCDDYQRIRHYKPRIVLVEAQDRLLAGGFHEKLGDSARKALEKMGVEIMTSSRVEDIGPLGVTLDNGYIGSATVLWTAGVSARTVGSTLGTETDRGGRVIVGSDWSVPGHPEVYVIGDAAAYKPEGAERPLPGVAPVAMQSGRYVAKHIKATLRGEDPPKFKYRDKGSMATIGRASAVVSIGKINLTGFIAWVTWLFVHLMYLVGFRSRYIVMTEWAWTYFTHSRGAALITGDQTWERAVKLAQGAEHIPPTGLRNVPASAAQVTMTPPVSSTVPSARPAAPADSATAKGRPPPPPKRAASGDT